MRRPLSEALITWPVVSGFGPAASMAAWPSSTDPPMTMHLSLTPVVSLIAGILILVVPRLLNYIVAIYLIVIGLLGLFDAGAMHLR